MAKRKPPAPPGPPDPAEPGRPTLRIVPPVELEVSADPTAPPPVESAPTGVSSVVDRPPSDRASRARARSPKKHGRATKEDFERRLRKVDQLFSEGWPERKIRRALMTDEKVACGPTLEHAQAEKTIRRVKDDWMKDAASDPDKAQKREALRITTHEILRRAFAGRRWSAALSAVRQLAELGGLIEKPKSDEPPQLHQHLHMAAAAAPVQMADLVTEMEALSPEERSVLRKLLIRTPALPVHTGDTES